MKVKTYLINQKESVDRRNTMLAELIKYPCMDVEIVEGINGKRLSPEYVKTNFDVLKFVYRNRRTPKRGEIGCILSHRECYKRLLDSDEDYALILEDDIVFFYPEKVEFLIRETTGKLKKNSPHVISFATHNIYYTGKVYDIDDFSFHKLWDAYGACAYLINRKAAERLLKISRYSIVADDFTFMKKIGILIEGIYPTFITGLSNIDMPTEIQTDHTDFIRLWDLPLWYQFKHCWARLYCKLLLSVKIFSYREYSEGSN